MKTHTMRRGLLLLLAITVLVPILSRCGHVMPIETQPGAGSAAVPGVSGATIPRPKPLETPPEFRPEMLPVPETPSVFLEGLPGLPVAAPRRPVRTPLTSLSLPVPIPLAAAPKVRPSYAMIQRALTDPTGLSFAPGASKALPIGRYEPPWRPSSAADGERTGGPVVTPTAPPAAVASAFARPAEPVKPSAGPVATPSTARPEQTVRSPAESTPRAAESTTRSAAAARRPSAVPVEAPPAAIQKTGPPASPSRAAGKTLAETAAGRGSVPITRPETGEAPRERAPSGAGAPGSPLPELTEVREVHREVLARRGDPVELSFEGEGWLFASGGRGSGADVGREAEGLEFGGSSSGQGRTRFSFTARALGEYSLIFQLQDHRAGMLRNEMVRLRVLDDEAFARELTGAAGAAGGAGDPEYPWRAGGSESAAGPIVSAASTGEHLGAMGASVPRADRLFELGEYELALDSYLREYRAGDPYLNERIAESYAAIGDYGAATTYYRGNLRGPADYRDRAIVGLVRSALALEDEKLVIDTIPALLTVESVPVQTELLGLARYLHLRARGTMAMKLLGEYARRYPFGAGMDEALYRMAQLYESESALRDLAAARSAYSRVYREWPESPFSEPAYQRLQYLERHFFDVR